MPYWKQCIVGLLLLFLSIPATGQIKLSRKAAPFTGTVLKDSDLDLQTISDESKYNVIYIPREWWLTETAPIIKMNVILPSHAVETPSLTAKEMFDEKQKDFAQKVESFFSQQPGFDNSVIIMDNIGKQLTKVTGATQVGFIPDRKFIFGKKVPEKIQQEVQNKDAAPPIKLDNGSMVNNDSYLQSYLAFLKSIFTPDKDALIKPTPMMFIRIWEKAYVYMRENLSVEMQKNLMAAIINNGNKISEVNTLQNLFDIKVTEANIDFIKAEAIVPYYLDKYVRLEKKPTKSEWKINDKQVDPQFLEDLSLGTFKKHVGSFIAGNNNLNLDVEYKAAEASESRNITAKFTYDNGSSEQYSFRVQRTGFKQIDVASNGTLGDKIQQPAIKQGEDITVELYELVNGTKQLVKDVNWYFEDDIPIVNSSFNFKANKDFLRLSAKKKDGTTSATLLLNIALNTDEILEDVYNQFATPTYNLKTPPTEKTIAKMKKRYGKALTAIKKKTPELYQYSSNQNLSLSIVYLDATNALLKAQKGSMHGKTSITPLRSEYDQIDLTDIELTDPANPASIIKDAKLILRLTDEEKTALKVSADKGEITDMANLIITRIESFRPPSGILLRQKIAEKSLPQQLLDTVCYLVVPDQSEDYYKPSNKVVIYLNYDILKDDDAELAATLAHELGHARFPFERPFESLKWKVIRETKERKQLPFDLKDELDENGHCSSGTGHEMYNPENEDVCTIGKKFKN